MQQPYPSLAEDPLRILVIGSTYPRHDRDYAVPWLRESHARLAARGHHITVLAPSYMGLPNHVIDGIPVHRFRYAPKAWERLTHEEGAPNKIQNPFMQFLGAPYLLNGKRVAKRLARQQAFDIVHVHWPFPHGPIGNAAAKAAGAPLVITSHGAEFALARRKKWVRPLLRNALLAADLRIANSEDTATHIKAISGCDAQVLPFGATVAPKPHAAGQRPHKSRPRVLFTGRLIARKGVEYLLKAAPRVLQHMDVDFIITGDGDQRPMLERLRSEMQLEDRVQFLGFVSNDQLNREYACCDVWVNPAVVDERGDTEGLGVGSIEAYAHGKPVVASAVGGIPDTVQHGKTGYLVPERDENALATAILELLESPERARNFGNAGHDFAQRVFSWERITDDLEVAYLKLLNRPILCRALEHEHVSAPPILAELAPLGAGGSGVS